MAERCNMWTYTGNNGGHVHDVIRVERRDRSVDIGYITTCTLYMYTVHVHCACTLCMYIVHVHCVVDVVKCM